MRKQLHVAGGISIFMLRGFAGRVKPGRAPAVCKRTVIGTLLFGVLGLAHVAEETGMGGAALSVVLAGLSEAELAIDGEADIGGVIVFLAVVFPPADGAKAERARGFQGFISTARAAIARSDSVHRG
jgi:hypothetical protein